MTPAAVSRRVTHYQPTLSSVRGRDLLLWPVSLSVLNHRTSIHSTTNPGQHPEVWPGSDSDEPIVENGKTVCEASSSVGAWDGDLRQFRFDLFTTVTEFSR